MNKAMDHPFDVMSFDTFLSLLSMFALTSKMIF